MNLARLFKLQRELDDRIMDKHPELKGQNNLNWKVLALKVELGECANEWLNEEGKAVKCYRNPLLEEYVDCLHFILSIGLELNVSPYINRGDMGCRFVPKKDITTQFNDVFLAVCDLEVNLSHRLNRKEGAIEQYYDLFLHFILLGEMLGFTWDEIEQAYLVKNKVNHVRQVDGY